MLALTGLGTGALTLAEEPPRLRLTVLGSAAAWTRRPGRASSCYLVELADTAVVLDLGQGGFSQLAAERPPETVAAVLISHLHADHLVDLVPLRHYLRYGSQGEDRPRLHGPGDLRRRFDLFLGEHDFLGGMAGEALEPGVFTVGPLRVEARHVTHIDDSYAFRLSSAERDGAGLVYSGDCAEPDDLLPLLRGGDTLLCEAAYGPEREGGPLHLNARQAADVARRGGAARLILTHVIDRYDADRARQAAADRFPAEVLLAEPGLHVTTD